MKHLFLFESFVEKLYEIGFSDHWIERTSLAFDKDSAKSRILKRSDEFPYGWRITEFVDNHGSEITVPEFFSIVDIDKNLFESLIVKSLYALTRSRKLRGWKKEGGKENQMLYLGRIAIWNGKKKFYPYLSAGKKDGGEYNSGDVIWGFAKEYGNIGVTVKYFPGTQEGFADMKERHRINTKLNKVEFLNHSEVEYPYGKNFEIIIDLTDPDQNSRENKIREQIEGNPIVLGPQPEKDKDILISKPEPIRKTLSPGDTIGVIVKYISSTEPSKGIIQEIINIQDIKDAQKMRDVTSITEIKIKFIPEGKNVGSIITLKDGSIISIGDVKYAILGPSGGKPLITSEPSIINNGKVQTWVIPI